MTEPDISSKAVVLLVNLLARNGSWTFSLHAGPGRIVEVGSDERAHVRVVAEGVAPFHFYLEREGDMARIVPKPGCWVCVNASPARAASPLPNEAFIEFGTVRMKATLRRSRLERVFLCGTTTSWMLCP